MQIVILDAKTLGDDLDLSVSWSNLVHLTFYADNITPRDT